MGRPRGLISRILLVVVVYYAAGRLGLLLAISPGYASALWPASGLALGAVLVWGPRVWPGIAVGSFLVNLGTSLDGAGLGAAWKSVALPAGIAAGAALQALAGAYLIRRFVGFPASPGDERAIGKFLVLGGPASCIINASISLTSLLVVGAIAAPQYLFTWWTWWIGDTIGVLLVAPLVLVWSAEPRSLWRRRSSQVAVPLLICSLLVAAFFVYARNRDEHRIRSDFDRRAIAIADRVGMHLATYSEALHGLASFFGSVPEIDRTAFRTFVERALERNAGFQALAWSPRIRDRERPELEQRARREGAPAFRIWEYSPRREVTPAARRDEYFPVTLLEPAEGNEAAIGFDAASEPTRLATLQRARDTGGLAVSDRISLVQEQGGQPGVLAFVPVYEGVPETAPETVEERRRSLRGFCVGMFRVHDMLLEALRGVDLAELDISVVDASGDAAVPLVAFRGGGVARPDLLERWLAERQVQFGERRWGLRFAPSSPAAVEARSWSVWIVLASGLLLTSLLGAFSLVVTGRSIAVATLVDRRTAALRQAEEKFRGLVESAPDAMVIVADRVIVLVNAQAERLFGYARRDLVGQEIEVLVPDRYRDGHRAYRTGYLAAPESRPMGAARELLGRRRDGSEFPVEISLSPMQTEAGLLVTATVRDITERKRLETERLQALREKEILLQEIHHRVKNSLQVVSSLFYLQSRRTEDPRFRQLLDESRDRVQSIALVHDQLYRSANLASIDFVGYLASLLSGLKATYGGSSRRIEVAVIGGDVSLDIERAVPCGLIVSELVSNAFKHAFPGDRAGKIDVAVRNEGGGEVVIEVADDGVGIPGHVDWRQPRSLGLQLVASLTTQLRATCELDGSRGTRFALRFRPI